MADNPIKYSDLVIDDGAIDQLIKKIKLLEKTFLASQKTFQKEIAKTKKATEDSTDATDNQEKELEKLEKQLEKLLKANEDLKTSEGEMNAQKKQALKLAKQEQTLKKKLIELTDDQALSNEELKLEIREQQKALKDQAKGNKGLTGEYEKQSKILNSLRKKYKDLAVAGKENSEEARKLLLSVTELDTKLKAVDKSVGQTQRSVGNYKDQVKEALEETGAFTESMVGAIDTSGALSGVMGKLGTIIELLRKAQDKLKDSVQAETVATEVQDKVTKKATFTQRLFSKATLVTAKAMKVLKAGLLASGIGIIVLLLGTLLATLTKTQAGLNGLDGAIRSFGAIMEVVVGRLITFGKGLGNIFSVLADKFTLLGLKFDKFKLNIQKLFIEMKNLIPGVNEEFGKIPEYANSIIVQKSTLIMSISQISETLFILAIPFFLKRFGIKKVMIISLFAWVLRFGLFAYGTPDGFGLVLIVVSMIVYGMAFDFFNISGSLFIEISTDSKMRGSAQGLFMMMTNGFGTMIGALGSGIIIDKFYVRPDGVWDWHNLWLGFAGYGLVVAILFIILFKHEHKPEEIGEVTH